MGDKSKIEWTDATWNPIRARNARTGAVGWYCEKVSPGCANCYAESINARLGTGLKYVEDETQAVHHFLDLGTLEKALRWRRRRRVFVCSMSDLFGEWLPDGWIDRVFATMSMAQQHTFQVLTKRPERMRAWFRDTESGATREQVVHDAREYVRQLAPAKAESWPGWPLPNVWLGVSAEDQQRLDERVPELLATPAAVRFVSAEPLLGPLDLSAWLWPTCIATREEHERDHDAGMWCEERAIDWVIVGGESGPKARPMHLEWADGIVCQCLEAGVPVFVKQLGAWPRGETALSPLLNGMRVTATSGGTKVVLKSAKGGVPEEWPESLRVREMPT